MMVPFIERGGTRGRTGVDIICLPDSLCWIFRLVAIFYDYEQDSGSQQNILTYL